MKSSDNLVEEADRLKRNIDNLKNEVEIICKKVGRSSGEVSIIVATKYTSARQVKLVYDSGLKNFGENRADQLKEKYSVVKGDPVWHFIGHLQSRKAKIVVPLVEFIHSIDRMGTLNKVNDEAKKLNKIQKVLIEVNISGEESKYGINPGDLRDFLKEALNFKNIKIVGLMTVAPLTDDSEIIREVFRKLRILRDKSNKDFGKVSLTELSMGMSNDYRMAVEEGATMIRIGSVIFK